MSAGCLGCLLGMGECWAVGLLGLWATWLLRCCLLPVCPALCYKPYCPHCMAGFDVLFPGQHPKSTLAGRAWQELTAHAVKHR